MFAYNPTVNDRSGELLAMGQMGAAQTNAQMMGQLGQDIGGALAGIGQMYGAIEERKAKGRAFKKTMEVMGPSLGMTTDKLQAVFGDVKTDMDYANLSDSLMPVMPAWINSTLAAGRLQQAPEIQTQRDTAASNRMYEADALQRERMYEQERLRREREAINNPPKASGEAFTRGNALRKLFQPNNP